MKRIVISFILAIAMTQGVPTNANADTNNCDVGTVPPSFSYLNPPEDPTKVAPGTVLLGKLTAYAATPDFGVFTLETKLEDKNSLPTYFFFYSNNSGKTWFCERSYSTMATTELKPNQDYVAIVVASSQGARGISTVAKFSTKKQVVRLCAPEGTTFSVKYQGTSFLIELRKPPALRDFPSIDYKVEVSIDGWKTKGVYREFLEYGSFMLVKPLSMTATHEFRLVQSLDELNNSPTKSAFVERYVSTGCATFATTAVAKDTRTDCEKNPYLDKCQITFAPGENADSSSQTSPQPTTSPSVTTTTTITCTKGKITKKVTALKPKCPKGYKVKK
jgi:hypothetical protein